MTELGQKRSTQAAIAPVPSVSPGPGRELRTIWDRRTGLVVIPLALIVLYAFLPTLNYGFLSGWDDNQNFLENRNFRGLSAAQVTWAWSTTLMGVYQPLAWMLFEAQYTFWKLDHRGYHATSLLLQVVNALVLYVLTMTLLARHRIDSRLESPWWCSASAGLATALFVVHPLRVEVVAWVSCQPYLACILFSMLSVLAYVRAFPTDSACRRGWLVRSFFLFVAALLFKAVAVSLPAVLLILDVYPLRRFPDATGRWFGASGRRALWEKVPFAAMSLLFMGVAIAARTQSPFGIEHYETTGAIAQACYAIWFYILKTLLPLDLIAFYPLPSNLNWVSLPYSVSILAMLALSILLYLLRRRWPGLLAAWLSYLVILAPNSGIIRNNSFVVAADRYSYMSMLGFVILLAAGFRWVARIFSSWPLGAIAIIVAGLAPLLGLTALTRSQCRTWRDTEVLWTHALTHGANSSFFVRTCLGDAVYSKGHKEESLAHYAEALRLNPAYDQACNNLGTALYNQGKYEAAESQFAEAVRLNPGNDKAHCNLGKVLSHRGNYDQAAAHFAEAVRLNPGYAEAYNNWGVTEHKQGSLQAAEAHYADALRLDPEYADAHNNRGAVLYIQGQYEAAGAQFMQAIRLNPDFADAHYNMGVALQKKGSFPEAETHYTDAVRLCPGHANAHNNLGEVLSAQGKYAAAAVQFTDTLRLNPGNIGAHYQLGRVFSRLENYEAAQAQFAEAIGLQPGDPSAYNASAMIMASCPDAKFRDGKRAVQLATRACELTQWKNPIILDTLAAAQAEAGEFDLAVKSQKTAIELLAVERMKDNYRSRLSLYQAKRPYRQVSSRHALPDPSP